MDGDSGGTPNPLNPSNNNENKILVDKPETEETIDESVMVEKLVANEPVHEPVHEPAHKLVENEKTEEAVLDANPSEIVEDSQSGTITVNRPESVRMNRPETVRMGGEIIPPAGFKKPPMNPTPRPVNRTEQIEDFDFRSMETISPNEPSQGLVEPIEQMGQIETLRETVDPMNRPMEKAPAIEPTKPKKKKIGVIIGIIISLLIATGCGVAAVLLATTKSDDPVAKAIEKIFSGNAPENIAYDGTLDINIYNQFSPISNASIGLKGEAIIGPMINSSVANVSANLRNGGSFSFKIDETYAANGDIYFKVNGASSILNDQYTLNALVGNGNSTVGVTEPVEATEVTTESVEVVDCEAANGEGAGCVSTEVTTTSDNNLTESIKSLLAISQAIDGEWVKVPVDSLSSMMSSGSTNGPLNCMAGLMVGANNNANSLASAYSKNAFIISSNKDIQVASQQNPIYKVVIDSEKFTNFISSIQETSAMNDFYACMGYENVSVNTDNLVSLFNSLPPIYVEINDKSDITRLYIETNNSEDFSTKLDFYFTYPANVNVPEPTQYTTVDEVYKKIVNNMLVTNTPTE